MFRTWALPFEVLSILLLAALVGAIVVSRPMSDGGDRGRPMSGAADASGHSRTRSRPCCSVSASTAYWSAGMPCCVLIAVELMLNAVNLIFITADATLNATLPHAGSVFALFVIVLAAAEIGVGLAVVLQLYRVRGMIDTDSIPLGGRHEGAPTDHRDEHEDAA